MLAMATGTECPSAARSRRIRRLPRKSRRGAPPGSSRIAPGIFASTPGRPARGVSSSPSRSGSSPAQRISVRTASATSSGTSHSRRRLRPDRRLRARHARTRSSPKLRRNVVGHRRRLAPDIGHRDDFPIAALGQRPQRPRRAPSRRARLSSTSSPMPSSSGSTSPSSSICRSIGSRVRRDRTQRPGAIEHESEASRPRRGCRRAGGRRRSRLSPSSRSRDRLNPPGDDFQPPLGDQSVQLLAATSGAMRWRWTSHHGRAWRRNRASAPAIERSATSHWLCGRRLNRPPRASRPPRRAGAASATRPATLPAAPRPARPAPGRNRHAPRGISPRRDKRDNPPAMPGRIERQHRIDHRQPGADEQHIPAALRPASATAACASAPHGLLMNRCRRAANGERLGRLVAVASTSAARLDRLAVRRSRRSIRRRRGRAAIASRSTASTWPLATASSRMLPSNARTARRSDEIRARSRLPPRPRARNDRARPPRRSSLRRGR